mmetsp:Transcript_23673/g.50664  ORF Transcript_23673/g.50664 Transcript_23673/m.50664 type:complete len:252 (-) Transcript_23673:177-932(-)
MLKMPDPVAPPSCQPHLLSIQYYIILGHGTIFPSQKLTCRCQVTPLQLPHRQVCLVLLVGPRRVDPHVVRPLQHHRPPARRRAVIQHGAPHDDRPRRLELPDVAQRLVPPPVRDVHVHVTVGYIFHVLPVGRFGDAVPPGRIARVASLDERGEDYLYVAGFGVVELDDVSRLESAGLDGAADRAAGGGGHRGATVLLLSLLSSLLLLTVFTPLVGVAERPILAGSVGGLMCTVDLPLPPLVRRRIIAARLI